ncbi:hypothetical protein DSCA_25940 [Desulfosarcina alkanivorans]|uniref:Methyltransferase type 11 domain-containing protein n=2 Tax=Desulfosarcina alkanivorans TaxID=571177 RepID=A0A5K7YQT3_9BACT|nr:hypothetical protein DSCA_25940 [Desulfosarcina alkanivorans]
MPVHTATFEKICSVNTIYFWTAPEATIKKMGRLLKPGGMLALGYEDIAQLKKRRLDTDVFRFYSHSDVETLVKNAGFSMDIRTRSIGFGPSVFHCTIAIK